MRWIRRLALALASLMDVDTADADFLADLIGTVQSLVTEFDLEQVGYRLISNGGRYQEVPHLHFHLISGKGLDEVPGQP